jgi:hypothetical protein
MLNQNFFFKRAIYFFCIIFISKNANLNAQTTTGNFSYPDMTITTSPKYPAMCDEIKGIQVACAETFATYNWSHRNGEKREGKTVTLNSYGTWALTVKSNANGVDCFKTIYINVYDLKDPIQIKEYFEKANFYAIPIWREKLPGVQDQKSGDRYAYCVQDEVKFVQGIVGVTSLSPIINTTIDNFKPIKDYGYSISETNNTCLCELGIEKLEGDFTTSDVNFWGHQFFASKDNYDGTWYIKMNIPGEESLPTTDQAAHLQSIHQDILTQNNLQDQVKVLVSNLVMARPIGGFENNPICNGVGIDLNSFFLTPSGHAIKLPANSSEPSFVDENNNQNVFVGALKTFKKNDKIYRSFLYPGVENMHCGYYSFINQEFEVNFGINSNNSISIIKGIQFCGTCFADKRNVSIENYALNSNDGGYSNTIVDEPNASSQISQEEANTFVYDLLCAVKHRDNSFTYDNKFKEKLIIGKDISLQGTKYDYIVVSTNYTNLFPLLSNPTFNQSSTFLGFENSYAISQDNLVRLMIFSKKTVKQKNKLKETYNQQTDISDYSWNYYYSQYLNCELGPDIDKATGPLKSYFNNSNKNDNLLIFVNGYRNNSPLDLDHEYASSNNKINDCDDDYEAGTYWGDVGNSFINKISTKNVVYADGHHSITTSNHYAFGNNPRASKIKFASGLANCLFEAKIKIPLPYQGYTGSPFTCQLDDVPNAGGFMIRYNNGKNAAEELWNKIKAGKIKVKMNQNKTKITGKIDIVAHSFGFAYSLGMVDYLKDKIQADAGTPKFGRYYILAPENACSAPPFTLSDFEEVWQYGTVEPGQPNPHKTYENDGVAPQCAVTGLDWVSNKYGRVPFQGLKKHLNFVDAHLGQNYSWVVIRTGRGEVKKR